MNPIVPQVQALAMQLEAMRGQLDALMSIALAQEPQAPPLEPGSCPKCGAPAEKQSAAPSLGGPTRMRCRECQVEWVASDPVLQGEGR